LDSGAGGVEESDLKSSCLNKSMAVYQCEYCYFLTKSRTNYNKHLTTEEHIKKEDIHEIRELRKLIVERQDELIMKGRKVIYILKQYNKSVKNNNPSLTLKNLFELENSDRNNIKFIVTNLKNRKNELEKKHNLI
jgi:hypothetical protein